MKAMVLAAGRGERMRPLSDERPKPLLEVDGKPLIVHVIERLVTAGFSELVINTAWLGSMLEDYLGDGGRFGANIAYSREPAGALGTAGGIRQALALLGAEPFVVVNGDTWSDFPFARLRRQSVEHAHLVLAANPAHHPRGDFGLCAGMVVNQAETQHTFTGIAVYHPELLSDQPVGKLELAPILRSAIEQGRVTGEVYTGEWLDIGTPERLLALSEQLARARR